MPYSPRTLTLTLTLALIRCAATFSLTTRALEGVGLDVLEALSTHRMQWVHGHELVMDHNLFYVVPQEQVDLSVTPELAARAKRALLEVLTLRSP